MNPKKPFKGKTDKSDTGGGNEDNNYRRKAWKSSGLTMVNGCLMAKCKSCGPNITHTTKYHAKWAQNQGGFSLPDTHPYVKEKALLLGVPHAPQAPQNSPGPPQPPAQGAASAAGTTQKTKQRLIGTSRLTGKRTLRSRSKGKQTTQTQVEAMTTKTTVVRLGIRVDSPW